MKKVRGSNLVRSENDLKKMRQGGRINAQVLKKTLEAVEVGISLSKLDQIAESWMEKLGAKPSFKTVPGYHFASCINLNDGVVHGLPDQTKVSLGDIISIDLGTIYEGWYTDTAWSKLAGDEETFEEKAKFLKIGEDALWEAIKQAKSGNKIGDISSVIQSRIEGEGYSIIKSLSGHGVGRSYHEEPEVPGYGRAGEGLVLQTGMTLAIEVIYAQGRGDVYEKDDGWTIASVDGSLTGLFEMTVIVGNSGAEVITDLRNL